MGLVDRTQNTLDATSQNYKYIVYIKSKIQELSQTQN